MEFPFSSSKRLAGIRPKDRSYPTPNYDPFEFHSNTFPSVPSYFDTTPKSNRDIFPTIDDDFFHTSQLDGGSYSRFTSFSRTRYVCTIPLSSIPNRPTLSHYGSPQSPPDSDSDLDDQPPYANKYRPGTSLTKSISGPYKAGDNNPSSKQLPPGTNSYPYNRPEYASSSPKFQTFPSKFSPFFPNKPRYANSPSYSPQPFLISKSLPAPSNQPQPATYYDPYGQPPHGYNLGSNPQTNVPPLIINSGNNNNGSGEQQNGAVHIHYYFFCDDGIFKLIKSSSPPRLIQCNSYSNDSRQKFTYATEKEEEQESDEYFECNSVEEIANKIKQDLATRKSAANIKITAGQTDDLEKLKLYLGIP